MRAGVCGEVVEWVLGRRKVCSCGVQLIIDAGPETE